MRIIAGKYKNRQIAVPKAGTRPTLGAMREAVFNICQQEIEGASVLDLFAGSGAIGLEALSRGATHVTFVENNRNAIRLLKQNIEHLQVETMTTVYPLNVKEALISLKKKEYSFDLIYIDPPYGQGMGIETLRWIDQSSLLKSGGRVFLEEAIFDVPEQWERLQFINRRQIGRSILFQFCHKTPH